MKKLLLPHNLFLIALIIISLIIFLPGFSAYFYQDDFFHLSLSRTLNQTVSAFNIFMKGEYPFYRPLTTQFYFYLGSSVFGLQPFWFHIINFLIFCINIILVYQTIARISKKKMTGLTAAMIYAINSTHIAPLYSAANIQELVYTMFGILTVQFFYRWLIKRHRRLLLGSIVSFIGALMCKETAIILPGILAVVYGLYGRNISFPSILKTAFVFAGISCIYLYAHVFHFGLAQSSSYHMIIGKESINVLVWYAMWALSVPNILIDFFGPGLYLHPRFFQVAGVHGFIFITFFSIVCLSILIALGGLVRKHTRGDARYIEILLGGGWFAIGMIPLIVFPLHHLATEQAFSSVGLALALSSLFTQSGIRFALYTFILAYLYMSINSVVLARSTHWVIRSSMIASRTMQYLSTTYPTLPQGTILYFRDGNIKIPEWGSSKQVFQALGNGAGIELMMPYENVQTYFEEGKPLPSEIKDRPKNIIEIDSSQLLGY